MFKSFAIDEKETEAATVVVNDDVTSRFRAIILGLLYVAGSGESSDRIKSP